MQNICPSFVGARVIRVTRLDNCGRPVYGPDSQVVTKGLVSVNIEPDIEEGEEFTQRNINGDLCVNEQGPDALRWFNLAIEFCQVDPCLWGLMNPSWDLVENAHGEVTGFRIGERFDDNQGFALEMWPKVSAEGALCDDDAPEEADPNGYFLLPYVIGRAPDGWTLENGVTTFTLNGRTKKGSLWGRGPYNVTLDADGDPTPLLKPIKSGAGGENPQHFHSDIVTLTPPEPTCGCQPLEPIAPSVEGGEITVDEEQPNRACFTVQGSAARQVTIDWGDGSDPVTSRVGREECHLYSEEGTYTVSLCDIDADPDDEDMCTSTEVTIDEVPALPDPVIEVTPTSGDEPLSVTLTVNNHGNGDVLIDWGDETEPSEHEGGDEDEPNTYPHQYLTGRAEPYTITVTAVQDDRSSATVEVQVNTDEPEIAPEISVDPTTGQAPLETTLTINNHGQGDVIVDFGDGSDPENIDGGDEENPATLDHTYTDTGEYTITVTDDDDSELSSSVTVTVEGEPEPDEPPTIVADPETGEAPLEVSFTSDNHGNGPVSIDPGDGSDPLTNAGDGEEETTHTYQEAGEYTATATSDADSELSSTVTVEVTGEEPDPDSPDLTVEPTEGQAPLEVTASVDNHGNGPVSLAWGDDSEAVEVADGESATYTYEEAGEYEVVATSVADETATVSETVTVTGEDPDPEPDAPVLDVTPTEGEVPLEVSFTADNHGNGPVDIDPGDGSDPITNAGDGEEETTHTYEEAGEYTATATSQDNPDLTGTATVEVTEPDPDPEPQAPDLTVEPTEGQAPLEVTASVDNHGNGPVSLAWGDDSEAVEVADGESATYTYEEAGEYEVVATSVADETATVSETVTVEAEPDPDPEPPVVTAAPTEGEAPLEVEFTVDNHDQGPVSIDPGDGSDPVDNPGDGQTTTSHTYTEAGEYTATATDQENSDLTGTATVEVTEPEPEVASPTEVSVPDSTSEELEVSWDWEAGEEGPEATGFEIRYRTPAGEGDWSEPDTVEGSERSHLIEGLTPDTEYEVGVTALADEARSEEVTATGSTTA